MTRGSAAINGAQLYYETDGHGPAFVMIHAGVADSRQWNHEFHVFAARHRVIRYDMRGYGRSEPVDGEFSHLGDLIALLDHLDVARPIIAMGCSMGGGIAMDYALEHPADVAALIMVGSGPSGLALDAPMPEKFAEVEAADKAGDLELVCEIETQIWFDGIGRTLAQVDPTMRRLAYEMNHIALTHQSKGRGKRITDASVPAARRLGDLRIPVLVIVGEFDVPYIRAAGRHMVDTLANATQVEIADAAHLPNMDHPAEFQRIVMDFIAGRARGKAG
jgi:2-hydroxy-6-oxonona-2,4-dienedioate hydrolase